MRGICAMLVTARQWFACRGDLRKPLCAAKPNAKVPRNIVVSGETGDADDDGRGFSS
jgi:hypothetical protein